MLFPCLGYCNNVSIPMGVQMSLQDPVFNYFGYIYSEVGLFDHMAILFLNL